MKILERSKLYSVVGNCPHCGSKLLLEKGDTWCYRNVDGSISHRVECPVCEKKINVEGWENIDKIL